MKSARECFYVIAGAFLYGIMPVIVKNTYSYGANGFNITFYMALFSVPIYLLAILLTRAPLLLPRKRICQCVAAGLADMGTFLLLYLSYYYIPVGVATMLNFIYPVTVALGLHFLFGERFGALKIGTLGIYLAGLFFLYGGAVSGQLGGFVLALLSGLCYTVHAILMDKSGLSKENVYTVGLYKTVIVSAVVGLAAVFLHIPLQIGGGRVWVSILAAAFLCRALSGTLVMLGIRGLGAFLPSVLSTVEPVVTLLAGWLLLNENMNREQIAGAALIIFSVVLIVVGDAKKSAAENMGYDSP